MPDQRLLGNGNGNGDGPASTFDNNSCAVRTQWPGTHRAIGSHRTDLGRRPPHRSSARQVVAKHRSPASLRTGEKLITYNRHDGSSRQASDCKAVLCQRPLLAGFMSSRLRHKADRQQAGGGGRRRLLGSSAETAMRAPEAHAMGPSTRWEMVWTPPTPLPDDEARDHRRAGGDSLRRHRSAKVALWLATTKTEAPK